MLYPTIHDLTKGKFNRYELAIATAKCARLVTDEYVRQREAAEKQITGNKDTDKPLTAMIDKEYRDEKAVKVAINRIHRGEYCIDENAGRNIPAAAPVAEPQRIDMDLLRAMADEDEDEDIDEEDVPAEDNE